MRPVTWLQWSELVDYHLDNIDLSYVGLIAVAGWPLPKYQSFF